MFLRDPAEIIYGSFNLNHMQTKSRIRENIYLLFIYKYHPMFKNATFFNMQNHPDSMLEGGDVLVLSRSLILIG